MKTKEENQQNNQVNDTRDFEFNKEFSERFRFFWDQYMKLINLLITLSTGTIVLFVKFIVDIKKELSCDNTILAITIIGFLSFGMFAAVGWRSLTQTLMSKEILGSKEDIKRYLNGLNLKVPITTFFEKHSEKRLVPWWKGFHAATLILLFIGWVLLSVFFVIQILN